MFTHLCMQCHLNRNTIFPFFVILSKSNINRSQRSKFNKCLKSEGVFLKKKRTNVQLFLWIVIELMPVYRYDREQDEHLISFSLYFCTNQCTFFTYLNGWDNRTATHSHQTNVSDHQHDQDDNIYQSDGEKTFKNSCLWHEIGLQICRPPTFKLEWQTNGIQGFINAFNLPSLS